MRCFYSALLLSASSLILGTALPAWAKDAPTPRRDPSGIRGISPFWEALARGDRAFSTHDLDGALLAYEQAVLANPQNALGHLRVGKLKVLRKRYPEARVAFETALNAATDAAQRAKALFCLADLSERERDLGQIVESWTAYEQQVKGAAPGSYAATASARKSAAETYRSLSADYAKVKQRIADRQREAEEKLQKSSQ